MNSIRMGRGYALRGDFVLSRPISSSHNYHYRNQEGGSWRLPLSPLKHSADRPPLQLVQLCRHICWRKPRHMERRIFICHLDSSPSSERLNFADHPIREFEVDRHPLPLQDLLKVIPECWKAIPCCCGHTERPLNKRAGIRAIALIGDRDTRLLIHAELFEYLLHRGAVLGPVAVRGVNDLKEEIGACNLFQRGSEGVNELMWQLVNEAHCIGDDRMRATRKA